MIKILTKSREQVAKKNRYKNIVKSNENGSEAWSNKKETTTKIMKML